jgi:photosystem II stability/assembly factor-like uncharacterized protein
MIKALLLITVSFLSSDLLAAYYEVQPTGTTNTLRSITFINQNTGFSVGAFSTILRTSNGGANWINIDISPSNTNYTCVAFANAFTGFVTSDDNELIKTTNGGLNWSISSFGSNPLKYIYFFNSSTGFIGGTNSALYKTTNGGENWNDISLGINEPIVRINFYDENFGLLLTRQYLDSGSVYKTTNGGLNWQRINNFYSGYDGQRALFDCVPLSRDTIYISLGYYQTGLMRTTNGGTSWQYIYDQFQTVVYPGSLYELFFIDRNNLIAMNGPTDGAPCYLIKSSNAGFNFTHPSAKRLPGYMYDGYFFRSSESAYMCGESGIITKVYSYITNIQQQTEPGIISGKITIAPNPGGNFLSIRSEDNSDFPGPGGELIIYDLTGRQVHTVKNTYFENINISHLPKSVYLIKIINSSQVYSFKKFVKIF